MYCPRCGASQPLGSRRCVRCGHPFTRRGYARLRPPSPPARSQPAPRARASEPGPGIGRRAQGCLALLILTVVLILAGVATFRSLVRPAVSRVVSERLEMPWPTAADQPASAPAATAPAPAPGGRQVVITQDELNQRIEANRARIQPLDSARVEIAPGAFAIAFQAYGLSGRYQGQVSVVDGQVTLSGGRITGPLGWVVAPGVIESALNEQLRAGLVESGLAVESVTLQEGQMTVTLAPSSS